MSHPPASARICLSREVRFAVNAPQTSNTDDLIHNGYGGSPALRGLGQFLVLRVTLEGALDPSSGYLLNIRDIDAAVRERAIPLIGDQIRQDLGNASLLPALAEGLRPAWRSGVSLQSIELLLSPFTSIALRARELPMVRFSQKFEFSASHRLHNPALSETQNRDLFGKCANPHGHGHNYEVQVTLLSEPGGKRDLVDVPTFERIVNEHAITPLDHRYLNVEIPEFREVIPTVENIARDIYARLKAPLAQADLRLASVTVWETPKTWAEYAEN